MHAPSPIEIQIVAGPLTVDGVLVTCVGPNLYRLEEEPSLFIAADDEGAAESYPRFGDVILTEAIDVQTVRYVSVHQRGPYRQFCYTLPYSIEDSPSARTFLAAVADEGGHWECQLGAFLLIALPEGSSLDPESALFSGNGEA